MHPKEIFDLFKDTFDGWSRDKAPRLGAALAYYTVFSIGPLLIIVIAIAGFFFGQQVVESQIMAQVQGLVGPQGAQFVEAAMASTRQPGANFIASIVGVVTLLLGALGVFGELQDSLNTIWEVQAKPGAGLRAMIKDRLLSFTMVLGTGFLLMVSLIISAALAALDKYFGALLPYSTSVLQGLNFFISLVVITLIFAAIFKYLPDAEIAWSSVWIGAALTALLFTIGKFLLGYYLGNSRIATAYGAAGSIVLVLVWIYYSAQILFFGAEFTKAFASRYGAGIIPAPNAVRVTRQARA